MAIVLASAKRFREMPQNCTESSPSYAMVSVLGKMTPDFPSKSSKFLSLENYMCTLAGRTNCGKWSLHLAMNVRI